MRRLLIIWRWLSSREYRAALDEQRRTFTQFRRQRDRLEPVAVEAIASGLRELRNAIARAANAAEVRELRDALRQTAYQHMEDPRRNRLRDYADMALTALVVAMAIRTFFVQPMEVPTASMEPTLQGVKIENLLQQPKAQIPGWWGRLADRILYGRTYYHIVAEAPGRLGAAEPPQAPSGWMRPFPTLRQQRFQVGDVWYTVWLPRLELPNPFNIAPQHLFLFHAGVDPSREYKTGEDIVKMAVIAGDHVLIDRMTIHFRRPRRGEIIVFRSNDIPRLREKAHYIKRLVGLGGETVQIGDDRHAWVNARRLNATTPGFEKIYAFSGPPVEGQYSGHLNDATARRWFRFPPGFLSPLFPNGDSKHLVRAGSLLVLGDNTVASFDSRGFGDLTRDAVVGRLLGVYRPLSPRFGFSQD